MTQKTQTILSMRYLRDLQDARYTLVQNDTDLQQIKRYFGITDNSITGCVVKILDGDYAEVWFSEASRWFELSAIYHSPEYYKA